MRRANYLPFSLLILAGGFFLVLGLFRGEHQAVLQKAAVICLECIGIG